MTVAAWLCVSAATVLGVALLLWAAGAASGLLDKTALIHWWL